jgi:hypothetical protein
MPAHDLDFPEIGDVYTRFAALTALSDDLGGCLLLYSGLDREGIAVAMASNVAGAASLGIEPEAERAKQALRAGVCDFVVNNLDEALRILKNEIRKRRAVSVVLTSEVDASLAEIIARGVQPGILAFPVRELMERGARLFPRSTQNELKVVTWSVANESTRWLPVMDALAAASIEAFVSEIDPRVRWIVASPRYLGRLYVGQRYLRMMDAEADAFVVAVRTAVKTGAISVTVSVTCGSEALSIAT